MYLGLQEAAEEAGCSYYIRAGYAPKIYPWFITRPVTSWTTTVDWDAGQATTSSTTQKSDVLHVPNKHFGGLQCVLGWVNCIRSFWDLNTPFKICVFMTALLETWSPNLFLLRWIRLSKGLTWDIHRLTDSFKNSCSRKNTHQRGCEPLWNSWREILSLPMLSNPKLRKKYLQTMNAAERGTSVYLSALYTEPIFLPTVIAKMAELQGRILCWKPYHESFD